MSKPDRTPEDPDLGDPDDHAGAAGRTAPVRNNVTGRVKFDDRGNAIWEWAVTTGSFGTQTLAISGEADANAEAASSGPTAPGARPVENRKGKAQGYSPYDSGLLIKAQAEAQRAKKKDLRRLGEWLKLREQANRNKRKDG